VGLLLLISITLRKTDRPPGHYHHRLDPNQNRGRGERERQPNYTGLHPGQTGNPKSEKLVRTGHRIKQNRGPPPHPRIAATYTERWAQKTDDGHQSKGLRGVEGEQGKSNRDRQRNAGSYARWQKIFWLVGNKKKPLSSSTQGSALTNRRFDTWRDRSDNFERPRRIETYAHSPGCVKNVQHKRSNSGCTPVGPYLDRVALEKTTR